MTITQRAASIAAAILCILGLAGVTTPSRAAELAYTPTPIIPTLNVPAIAPVPLPAQTPPPAITAPVIPASPVLAPAPAPAPHYASLAAAVAAQDVPDAGSEALGCLAGAIYFESKGEPLAGQLAVANVIINRARSGRYPPDICGVVTQRGQFSFVHGGRMPAINEAAAAYRTAKALAQIALNAAWDSPAPRALFFHARRVGMSRGGTQVASIGNHIFYR